MALPASYALSAPIFSPDFRLTKKFTFRERYQLSATAEMFNAFNEANFQNPNAVFGTAAFGTIGATSIDNREIQFGAKLQF